MVGRWLVRFPARIVGSLHSRANAYVHRSCRSHPVPSDASAVVGGVKIVGGRGLRELLRLEFPHSWTASDRFGPLNILGLPERQL